MRFSANQKLVLASSGVWAVSDALTSSFLIAFALLFGASNVVVGILGAMPYIASVVVEIPGAKLSEFFRRKKICMAANVVSRFFWLLMVLVPFFFQENPLLFIVVFFAASKLVDILSEPAWVSLTADVVPAKIRGRFFGARNMVIGLAGMVVSILGGFYLDLFEKQDVAGFVSLFVVGVIFGWGAVGVFSRIREPQCVDHVHHSWKDFVRFGGVFRRFCVFSVLFNFGVMIASPFFSAFMLKDLGLSYVHYTIFSAISLLPRIFLQKHLGKMADTFGDKPVAVISTFGTALVPFLFLFVTPENWWLLVVAQFVSGVVWAGVDLTMLNLLLDFTRAEGRAVQFAVYATVVAVPNIVSPIIGGVVADYGSVLFLSGIPLVFAISSLLRLLAPLLLVSIPEPRVHKEYRLGHVLYQMVSFHPNRGFEHRVRVAVRKVGNKMGVFFP